MCRYERCFLRIKKLSLLLYHAQCAANRVQQERARSDAESFKLAFEAQTPHASADVSHDALLEGSTFCHPLSSEPCTVHELVCPRGTLIQ